MNKKIRQIYNKYSLYMGFSFIVCIGGAVIALLLLLTSKYYVSYHLNNYLQEYVTCINDEFETSMLELSRRLHMNTVNLNLNKNLLDILTDQSLSEQEKKSRIIELGCNMPNNNLIERFAIISYTGEKFCFSSDNVHFEPIDTDFITGKTSYDISLYKENVKINDKNYFVFGKKLSNYYSNFNMGYIECYINEDYIYNMYRDSNFQDGETFISCGNNVISHKDKSLLGDKVYIPEDLVSTEKKFNKINSSQFINKYSCTVFSAGTPLDMISILYSDSYYKTLKTFNTFILLIFVFNVLISIIISRNLSGRLTTSLSQLAENIDEYPKMTLIPNKQNHEIAALEERFILFEQQIDELIKKNEDEKKKQKIAELAALQAQINPHFIYNALDSMSWIAKINHQKQIENMSVALASYFRLGLHNGENTVVVRDEINHVKSYITIEQIRFPEKFSVEFDIADEIYDLMTLKTILQPIVENCIKHGFKQLPYKGLIKIKGCLDKNDIIFIVSDNGHGMDFDPLTRPSKNEAGGYGVKNVQNRILLEYGAGYGLFYKSSPEKGTAVTVRIKNVDM